MSRDIYSIYDAKARFSEVLRKVKKNKRVIITSRGKPIAEIVPFTETSETLEDRLRRLEADGLVDRGISSPEWLEPIDKRDGVLKRFRDHRE